MASGRVRVAYNPATGELPEDVPQVPDLMTEAQPRPHAGWVTLNWNGYGPRCSCGWRGTYTSSHKMALASAGRHRKAALR